MIGALASAGAAFATSEVTATPTKVTPLGKVTVDGHCPDPLAAGAYVRATVGVDAIDRYVIVPVADGAFHATFKARGAGTVADPEPGDKLKVQVSCATSASFVAPAGTATVKVVEADAVTAGVQDAAATAMAKSKSKSKSKAHATSAATSSSEDSPVGLKVPLIAFAVAVIASLGAYALSRRHDKDAAA